MKRAVNVFIALDKETTEKNKSFIYASVKQKYI